jgi:hypothetical protein
MRRRYVGSFERRVIALFGERISIEGRVGIGARLGCKAKVHWLVEFSPRVIPIDVSGGHRFNAATLQGVWGSFLGTQVYSSRPKMP